ncbi:MAG: radical SAM family heme chaperone HemW [Pseudomonadota bacterium]
MTAPPAAPPVARPAAPLADAPLSGAPRAAEQGAAAEDWRAGGFGVYVHWPFCLAKCPYCDFNSHVAAEVDHARWRRALTADLRAAAAETPGRRVDSVFFGGGTPSLMPPETTAAALDTIRAGWELAEDAEITLEANPTSVEAGRFRAYAAAGVNRLSLGVQALNDADLKALGRTHDAAEARAAFDIARAAFARVSFDLIYARVGQTAEGWAAELAEAIDMAVDHLSLYQLTIEPGTRFFELRARGKLTPPEDDDAADMYARTQEVAAARGLPAYEVSNHARPGAESRHNLVYWRMGDYVGAGPGAHGRLTLGGGRVATEAERDPTRWLERVETAGRGERARTPLDARDQALEHLVMGLRLREGVSRARAERLAGRPLSAAALAMLRDEGLVALDGDRLAVTEKGRPILNAVLREATADL